MNNQQNSNVVSDEEIKVLAEKAIPDCRTLGDDLGLTYPQSALPKIKRGAWHAGFKSALKYKSKTIIEPIKDEEVNDELSAEKVIKNCLEAIRWNMEHANVVPEYQEGFFNINANAVCDCEEFIESKLNNSVEDKPELTGLLCNGRKVEVNDKDYVVTSATRATNNSIIFHLSGEKDSLQLKLEQC